MDRGDKVSVTNSITLKIKSSNDLYTFANFIITPEAVGTVITKLLPGQSDQDWCPCVEFDIINGIKISTFIERDKLKEIK
jgi:hypothetical protein